MTDRTVLRIAATAGGLCLVAAGVVAGVGAWHTAGGILAGVGWNAANLWCLVRLVRAWLGPNPSTPRLIGWGVVKVLVLYGSAIALLRHPGFPILGFTVGFTVVLAVAMGFLIVRPPAAIVNAPHGR